ncbi:MAG TPA: malto-oligosyltrehalose trehalohydrolase [Pseudolabrys sp.]
MTDTARFGPTVSAEGVTFRLWAPAAERVDLVSDGKASPMTREADGWYELFVPGTGAGTRYGFRIDDELDVPDPASHFQPDDVHGPSEVIDHGYRWTADAWTGRPWETSVFLELHIGTFTPEGTYRAAIDKLDHLVETGITAIELMPLADFPGRWNWGYDGVLPYAPDHRYGRPDDLKALIDAAHQRGLMVFLDVVYNHFGPDGNYLGRYAPAFFTDAQTPWGSAIDYRVPEVRGFAIDNALHWLRHYRFDGLRLDAVHAIVMPGEPELLRDLSAAAAALAAAQSRAIHLVLENDDNRAALLDPAGAPGTYRAQWNDDFHHAWHVLLTGETGGYYGDYAQPASAIARALAEGFVYQGQPSAHRNGAARGEPSRMLPPTAFVNFLQNHDQIGNRARGERLSVLASSEELVCALSVLLLAPSPPLLFMGEEWGATEPFPFFCDFSGDLADAVRDGRRREFADAYASAKAVPDPLARETVKSATLDWSMLTKPAHRQSLALVRDLLAVRHREIVPAIPRLTAGETRAIIRNAVLDARWAGVPSLRILANLSHDPAPTPPSTASSRWIWGGAPDDRMEPWAVHAALESAP